MNKTRNDGKNNEACEKHSKVVDRVEKAIGKNLDILQTDGARKKLDAIVDARGKSKNPRPKAGSS